MGTVLEELDLSPHHRVLHHIEFIIDSLQDSYFVIFEVYSLQAHPRTTKKVTKRNFTEDAKEQLVRIDAESAPRPPRTSRMMYDGQDFAT